MENSLYKASRNLGIYQELCLLLDYIEDDKDLNSLDYLLKSFINKGLTSKELKQAIELINNYLPTYLECDLGGCYLTQEIQGMPANTYIDDINLETSEVIVNNLLLLTR